MTTRRTPKRSADSGTARTTWCTKPSKTPGCGLTRAASGSSSSSTATDFRIAVVTSSQNCDAVLKAAGLEAFFDARVDGNVIQTRHLAGKPAPDTFLTAASMLQVAPARAVVIEDAIAGVQAGAGGHFGLVIGVARKGNAEELRRHGAHLVMNDLGELSD